MKFPFFKTLFVAGSLALICSCDTNPVSKNDPADSLIVTEPSYVYVDKDKNYYVITESGIVTDTTGAPQGIANIAAGTILDNNGNVIAENVNFEKLSKVEPTVAYTDGWLFRAGENYIIQTNFFVTNAKGENIGFFQLNEDNPEGSFVGTIITSEGEVFATKVDLLKLKQVKANVIVSSSSVEQPKSSSSNGATTTKSSGTVKSSSSSAPKSSSSTAKSSSSNGGSGSTYTIKYINGGKSGSGYASRYWDCCKPHCAWPEHGGTASTCDANGNKLGDKSASSMCDWGNAGICRSQFPIVVNDTLAFAFAATPGGENNCGKCFDLQFTGEGKYDTNLHGKLKGKHLIVMSNNVGYDVAGGQFDVMIPGGGYGIFDGCSKKMGWGSQGSQYGGLLDECEKESNYAYTKYKSCLTNKCNSSFANDKEAREGCLFMANWMNAAGNPLHNYKEVECPKELKDRY